MSQSPCKFVFYQAMDFKKSHNPNNCRPSPTSVIPGSGARGAGCAVSVAGVLIVGYVLLPIRWRRHSGRYALTDGHRALVTLLTTAGRSCKTLALLCFYRKCEQFQDPKVDK